jgi:hypothetical protein
MGTGQKYGRSHRLATFAIRFDSTQLLGTQPLFELRKSVRGPK